MNMQNKNIIIIGCPRSGKTTLTNMIINNNSEYNSISIDGIVKTIRKNIPTLKINEYTSIREISKIIIPILETYLKDFLEKYPEKKYIIDGAQILPEDIMENDFFNKEKIVCLGFPNAVKSSFCKGIRVNDRQLYSTWSKNLTDEQLDSKIESCIRLSIYLKKSCTKYEIPFYETDIDRDLVLKRIYYELLKKENEIENNER